MNLKALERKLDKPTTQEERTTKQNYKVQHRVYSLNFVTSIKGILPLIPRLVLLGLLLFFAPRCAEYRQKLGFWHDATAYFVMFNSKRQPNSVKITERCRHIRKS